MTDEKQQTVPYTYKADTDVQKASLSQQTIKDVLRDFGNIQNALYSFTDSEYWIKAYEELEKRLRVPEAAVKVCLYIFHDAFRFCGKMFDKKRDAMLDAMCGVLHVPKASIDANTAILISEYIQMHADLAIDKLRKDFISCGLPRVFDAHKISSKNIGPYLQAYAMKAVELAWFAVIDDPPLELEIAERGSLFDRDKYTPYTRTGEFIDYVIWPVIMYKDGTILCKGVAEGRQK
ncbi:hypothetical protein DPMN_106867 [Dreissena polymorpha]|uniref:Mitochondria-eating protein C-terminal domain-containing protein n=1 Tax=Dreissena polymorpha TaxID=45954 RepID=A0A9D4K604_DREPO|nr:hypothetical protein DPMN_106867 [Dreissena polymorpha]